MKRKLLHSVFSCALLFIFKQAVAQTNSIYESYVILSINGSLPAYYDMAAATSNVDFQGANLGDFDSSNSLVIKGGQNKTVKCNGGNTTGGTLYYRVWLTSAGASGSFTGITMNFGRDDPGAGSGCQNQSWQSTIGTANLLVGLPVGNYTIEVYSDAGGNPGTAYSSNFGVNYKATFNYTGLALAKDYTWNGSADVTWENAKNWTPEGRPSSIDNVTINVQGNNILNLPSSKVINNFTINGTGTFVLTSTGALTINGNINYGGRATATLDCASLIKITNSASQPIPPFAFGNLNVLGGNRVLPSSGTVGICSDFTVDQSLYSYIVVGSSVNYFSSASGWMLPSFTYNNLTLSGSGDYSIGKSLPAMDKTINVQGNFSQSSGTLLLGDTSSNSATLNVDGNATLTGGTFKVNTKSGGTGIFNLKGNLSVASGASLLTDSGTGNFNFTGVSEGSSTSGIQTIDVLSVNTAKINFSVKPGAYVKLINQDFILGSGTKFTVESGGTFDFGFNSANTALNLTKAIGQTLQQFELKDGGTLKITSPLGISKDTNTADGNVLLPTRIYAPGVNTNYLYIGRQDQITGNGLPTSSLSASAPSRNVIVAMENEDLILKATGVQRFNSFGTLEIQKGIVDDEPSNNFSNSGIVTELGNLKMSGGRYILNTSDVQPDLLGNYTITGGTVEFKNSTSGGQTIRGGKSYYAIEVTGSNVGRSVDDITLLANGSFTIKNGGLFTINSKSIVGPVGIQTFKVENGGSFRTGDSGGFSGSVLSSIQPSVENIILADGSTVEYSRSNSQIITSFKPLLADESNLNNGGYYNLKLTGDNGTTTFKTIADTTSPVYVRNNLQIDPTSILKIEADKTIIIKENISNNGSMIIENDGNLIQKDDLGNFAGNDIIAKRNVMLSTARQQYNYLISPVENQNLTNIYKDAAGSPITVPYVLYHNEANNKFFNSSGAYIKGRALAVKEPSVGSSLGATMGATFRGRPTNGAFEYVILNSNSGDVNRGYNLIGNPYPSYINLISFYQLNGSSAGFLDSTFYFWDNKANNETAQKGDLYGGQAYAQFNAATPIGIGTGVSANGDAGFKGLKTPTNIVKTGQGFMVKSKVATTVLRFNNSIRTAQKGGANYFGKIGKEDEGPIDRYWLSMTSPSNITSTIAVVYFSQGNNNFTQDDSRSMGGSDVIYSLVENEKLSINGRSNFVNTDIIPLGTQNFVAGNYTISLSEKEGVFSNGQRIFLKDAQTGILTNLSAENYTFHSDPGEAKGRFTVLYLPEALLAIQNDHVKDLQIYRRGEILLIESMLKTIDQVKILDTSGRLIFTEKPVSRKVELPLSILTTGIYFINIEQKNKIKTVKIIK